jgi:hypothetical protein
MVAQNLIHAGCALRLSKAVKTQDFLKIAAQ